MTRAEFEDYFLGYGASLVLGALKTALLNTATLLLTDCIVGVLISSDEAKRLNLPTPDADGTQVELEQVDLLALSDVDWATRYAFSYYIKPNYPGRSSHLCNAGFIVPLSSRGLGLGSLAGLTFTHYGPAAGYRGSVFNLVYASNVASVRIWQALGFDNVGLIPGAGLLKDGDKEVYTDAWVVHGDFEKITKLKKDKAAALADKATQIAADNKATV